MADRQFQHLKIALLILGFVMLGICAGYYFLQLPKLTYVSLSSLDREKLSLQLGETSTLEKCTTCHSLDRVYRAYKSEESWEKTVNRMAELDLPNITTADVEQVLNYLIERQKEKEAQEAMR